jgi:hypothetical protein
VLAVLVLCGCGGTGGGDGLGYGLAPNSADLPPSGGAVFEAFSTEEILAVEWTARGGTVVQERRLHRFFGHYVAPSSPGIYHLDARIETDSGDQTVSAMIVVN